MTDCFEIFTEAAADKAEIKALHEEAFGPGRYSRTAYRIRERSAGAPVIALTARQGARLAGSIHFTAIAIGGVSGALLLGPLAIAPAYKNKGCGLKLMRQGIEEARKLGFALVILVGDLPYYSRVGFVQVPPGRIELPGPADPSRLLALALEDGALERFYGIAEADNSGLSGGISGSRGTMSA